MNDAINPASLRNDFQKIAAAFRNTPEAAYRFARALDIARDALTVNERAVLDELIEALFPYTSFYDACHHLYWMAIRGKLKPEHDPLVAALAADPKWSGVRTKPTIKTKK